MKKLFDILFSFIALVLLFIPLIIIGILIKLDSRGKIFFVQKRVGKNFGEFSLYKFRTMREGSEKSGMLTIGERDSRITRMGFYLRKYKLDELPQFINVLKGDMSIVGPRPEVKKYVGLYSEEQRKILSVRPGITDIASVQFSEESGMLAKYPNAEEAYIREIMPAKISLSLAYLQRRSIVSDISIIVKTIGKIFSPLAVRGNLETVLLSLLVFSLPLYEKVSAGLAVAIALYRIFNKKIIPDVQQASRNTLVVLFIVYYLAHLAGTFYSSNLDYAFFDLQIKLPFLFFPLLLAVPLERPSVFQILKKYFIAGCTAASLLCLVAASISFLKSHDPFDFYYIAYSRLIHPTYFSIFLNLCILFLIGDLITGETLHRGGRMFKLVLLIFLFVTVILLAARTATFTCFITAFFYSIAISIQHGVLRKTYKAIALLLIILVATGVYSNHIYNRFDEVTRVLREETNENKSVEAPKPENYTSVSIRMELWKDSWELIKQNIMFGVGTGDVKDVLQKKYAEAKFFYGAEKKFNPHNQFLHTAVTLGLMGLTALVLLLFVPAFRALKNKNYLFVCLCAIIALNCMTESVLEVQKGVLFFSVFGLLLFNLKSKVTD